MKKILMIDDEPAILEMYRLKFEERGFTVTTALNSDDGFTAAIREHPDIILLDIVMPKTNGLDLLKALKENEETKNVPVIMTTNLPENTSGQKAKELGAEGYIVKAEYEPKSIVTMVEKFLGK